MCAYTSHNNDSQLKLFSDPIHVLLKRKARSVSHDCRFLAPSQNVIADRLNLKLESGTMTIVCERINLLVHRV